MDVGRHRNSSDRDPKRARRESAAAGNGFRRSEGRWSVPPGEREGDDRGPRGRRLREGERPDLGYRGGLNGGRHGDGRCGARVTAADARARPVVAGRRPMVGMPRRGVGPGRTGTVMVRTVMGPERVPDPAHEKGKGQREGEPASDVTNHNGESSQVRGLGTSRWNAGTVPGFSQGPRVVCGVRSLTASVVGGL